MRGCASCCKFAEFASEEVRVLQKAATVILFCTSVASAFATDDLRVLLPVGLVHFNGAFGSVWESELTIKNATQADAHIGSAADLCVLAACVFPGIQLDAGQTRLFSDPFNSSLV